VTASILPGHVGVYANSPTRRRFRHNSFAFKVAPAQPVFAPGNVLTGVTRPGGGTNLWRSDAAQTLPQWIELAWGEAKTIRRVELTFSGHTWAEVHMEPGFFRDAQTVRDYAIEVDRGGGEWVEVLRIFGNYQRQRAHELDQAESVRRLRVVVLATNGDPSAALYEIRCY
jgi:hypothetical protein